MATRGASFPDSRRVKRRGEYLHVQSTGRKFRTKHFLLSLKGNVPGSTRLGITITTKISKRAVRRNRLRRRIRELFRANLAQIPDNQVAVIIALTGATDLDFPEVEKELCTLLRDAKRTVKSAANESPKRN